MPYAEKPTKKEWELAEEFQMLDERDPSPVWVLIAYALALLVIVGGLFWAASAFATEKGEMIRVSSTILCDEREMLVDIMEAQKESVPAGIAMYQMYSRLPSKYHGPACVYVPTGHALVVTFVDNAGQVDGVLLASGVGTVYLAAITYEVEGLLVPGYVLLQKPIVITAKGQST